MIYRVLLLSLLLLPNDVHGSPPEYGEWNLLSDFSDEFKGATVNSNKWQTNSPHWGGRPPGLYTSQNTMVWKDELTLITHDDSDENRRLIRTGFFKSKQAVQYGYIEIKAKAMPSFAASGFFLYKYTDNATYEIDIVEIGGTALGHEKIHHSNAHVYYGDPTLENDQNRISSPKSWSHTAHLSQDYHLYALEWDDLELRWYFDGQLIRRKPNQHWHLPMHIHLTTEVVSSWFGVPEAKNLPQAFYIDYIRTWKRTDLDHEREIN
jgi:beta-glucanase (GH16 family)